MNELIRDVVSPLFDKVFKKLDIIDDNIAKLDQKINNLEKKIIILEHKNSQHITQHNNDHQKHNRTEYYL